jgi:hypothetical protein
LKERRAKLANHFTYKISKLNYGYELETDADMSTCKNCLSKIEGQFYLCDTNKKPICKKCMLSTDRLLCSFEKDHTHWNIMRLIEIKGEKNETNNANSNGDGEKE